MKSSILLAALLAVGVAACSKEELKPVPAPKVEAPKPAAAPAAAPAVAAPDAPAKPAEAPKK